MSSTIEIKEQIKELQSQERQAQKLIAKKKKDYQRYKLYIEENPTFAIITQQQQSGYECHSFEELVKHYDWDNKNFENCDWEFMFLELGYKDTEFFSAFMSWDWEKDNQYEKCCICYDYYNYNANSVYKKKQDMKNCSHNCCYGCYINLKTINEYRICMVCRQSENPMLHPSVKR